MGFDGRLAAAPISWGVCEVPGWGLQLSPDRVLAEMAALGLEATELGPTGYLPTDPHALRELLESYGLELVAGFVPVILHDPAAREATLATATASARTLAAGGAEVFVSAVVTDADWAPRIRLDAAGWRHLVDMLARLDELAAEHGLAHALHPHVGTLVETAEDVRRVLDSSDVGWCMDTGHLMIGGTDPTGFAEDAGARVRHVHLKDVRAEVAARLGAGDVSLVQATREGLFCPLGQGDARVADTLAALRRSGYAGWYVLEQDAALTGPEPPVGSGPVDDVRASVDHLRSSSGDSSVGEQPARTPDGAPSHR
ncbi:MAG: TIM barrel protein [Egibacteraceae bacterium]